MFDRDAPIEKVTECSTSSYRGMAPSPETDSAPKAPDKPKCTKEKSKEDKTLSDLNDCELKGLLDEALNYKNPKDREGKSKLFNNLLNEAEEDERNARAARAGGSNLVRHCNPSAKRNSRHRKKPSSISENMMHGGSLDNLAKEELYETSKHRTKKSVSARQREGGSLPCNVNSSIITHDYQFLEEARKKKETEKITTDVVEEQRLLEHDTLDQNFQEKVNELPQLKFTTRASLQVNEVDGPIQFSHLEQGDRKNCSKSVAPIIGGDCAGTFRISNDTKKVDENGNLHQTSLKMKKKKVADKNVVVCKAENVEGHRSDIITDIDKLVEYIGITEDSSEKNRSLKSKQLNRHSSDDTSKSKKRAHSSKSKDNRSKLKKSNSLGEISTTNLEDFEFKDKVVMRNKNSVDKPRERRSWGNMEPLQNLYSNASAENLESAEFRVVTKKKKSKKRRNSISGRSKPANPAGKPNIRGQSPELRRKSACSVPHSEKSNDSSDVDSVHSLPIDTQRLDLATARLNMPISYADMAKTNEKPKEKKPDKVPKETTDFVNVKCVAVSNQIACDLLKNNNNNETCVKNTPPDVHNIKNFPAISKINAKMNSNNKVNKNAKNVKNNVNRNFMCITDHQNNIQNENMFSSCNEAAPDMGYSSSLPPDIPDVQTIEKMQLINQGHPANCYDSTILTATNNNPLLNNGNDCSVDCDIATTPTSSTTTSSSSPPSTATSDRTNNSNSVVDLRPPVVILSGYGNSKEVPGLVFGFDINEQLLSEDNQLFSCEDFISRYIAPQTYTTTSHNHDKIVSYIGAAWEEAAVNVSSGKVQYYSDML